MITQCVLSQTNFISVEHNKVLCLLSFMDTASQSPGSSPSYISLIQEHYGEDEVFKSLVENYRTINFRDAITRERFPKNREYYTSVQDLLWMASSSSRDLQDFSKRSFGILTPEEHNVLMDVLKEALPYYDKLVWNPTSEERVTMEVSMKKYNTQITAIFNKVQHFLGSFWDEQVPFKIMLYPIPLKSGATTAIPKGNNLICSYLSKRDGEAKDVVAIAVHEMNHILYSAQPLAFQEEMDGWFRASDNPVAQMAYNFFDEGLATAVGNGWAYEQLNGKVDQEEWYNVSYINTFGKQLYPLVKEYMASGKKIDKHFIDQSIALFAASYPKANTDLGILMNSVSLIAQSDEDDNIDLYFNTIAEKFTLRSANFIYPVDEEDALSAYKDEQQTKVIVLDKDQERLIAFLALQFDDFPKNQFFEKSTLVSFFDTKTSSPIILLYLKDIGDFVLLMDTLKADTFITYGKVHTLD